MFFCHALFVRPSPIITSSAPSCRSNMGGCCARLTSSAMCLANAIDITHGRSEKNPCHFICLSRRCTLLLFRTDPHAPAACLARTPLPWPHRLSARRSCACLCTCRGLGRQCGWKLGQRQAHPRTHARLPFRGGEQSRISQISQQQMLTQCMLKRYTTPKLTWPTLPKPWKQPGLSTVAVDRLRGGSTSGSKLKQLHHVITSSHCARGECGKHAPCSARIHAAPRQYRQASKSTAQSNFQQRHV